jgi:outer membrane protein
MSGLVSLALASAAASQAPAAVPAPAFGQLDAQMTVDGKPVPIDTIAAAELLMQGGHPAEARKLLEALEKSEPRDNQTQFLLALLDMGDKDHDSAIRRLHRILVSEPKAVRVRLELGRAYFERGDYGNAERQFRFARAGRNPPGVTANIDHYLIAIRSLKRLSFAVSLAVAPDTCHSNCRRMRKRAAVSG